VAEAGFAQRRKTIRNSLGASLGLPAAQVDAALEAAGMDGSLRAEAFEPEAFVDLARALADS
jgi:16S rRNA (adenine1518-N6/adenine1519-N6)-dimethyltransferase